MNQNYVLNSGQTNNELDQLGLGIKVKRFQPLTTISRRLNQLERRIEVMPFWKNFSFIFMFTSSIAFPAILEAAIFFNYQALPFEIPLFFDPTQNSWMLIEKGWIIFIPIGYGVANLFLLNITYSIFQFDRRLAQIISLTVNIFNTLFLVAFAQLLSIVLI